jgi:hypothetical protein
MVVEHSSTARAVYALEPPAGTVEGALGYVTRLLAALPAEERAGYLLKPGGENIAPLPDGAMVSVGRLCYPDGQIYKVMTDVPHGEPEWADDGTVDPSRYRAFAPAAAPSPAPSPSPSGDANLDDVMVRLNDIALMIAGLRIQLDANTEKIQQQIDQAVKNAESTGRLIGEVVEPLLPALSGLFSRK